jgi:hypothetical protein
MVSRQGGNAAVIVLIVVSTHSSAARDGCNTNCPRNGRQVVFAARGFSLLRVAACGGVIYA